MRAVESNVLPRTLMILHGKIGFCQLRPSMMLSIPSIVNDGSTSVTSDNNLDVPVFQLSSTVDSMVDFPKCRKHNPLQGWLLSSQAFDDVSVISLVNDRLASTYSALLPLSSPSIPLSTPWSTPIRSPPPLPVSPISNKPSPPATSSNSTFVPDSLVMFAVAA